MKKNRDDESIRVIIRLHMEMSQGNLLCSYPKQAKCHFFPFYKIGEQEGRTGSTRVGEGLVTVGGRMWWRQGIGG
jgi:hypothetical protein